MEHLKYPIEKNVGSETYTSELVAGQLNLQGFDWKHLSYLKDCYFWAKKP